LTFTLTPLLGFPIIKPGDDLADLILQATIRSPLKIVNGDIFVIAQKIVSKAENRFENELIIQESNSVLRSKPGTIIVEHRLGFVCANAGIDHSNVKIGNELDEWVLLLPKDPSKSAALIRKILEDQFGKRIGVVIIDSHGRAWRLGTVGVAIGFSGIPGIEDLRGNADMFGRKLQVTQIGAADELAAAASLIMGQASEGTPVVHVRGFPYALREGSFQELLRPLEEDMFR
jgi:coenzyme F420-0:L-glutamate ligase/coenzyme F420-1:gamma-L-glutamate ligase